MKFLKLFAMFNLLMYIDGGNGGGSDGGSDGGDAGGDSGGDNGAASGGEGDGGGAPAADGGDGGANPADGGDASGGELLAGKYKDQAALVDGYKNLEQMFGSFTGTPKDGYAAIDGIGETSADQNRLMSVIQEAGKDMNLSQDGYENLYKNISEMQDRVAEENIAAVIKEIPNFDTRQKQLVDTAIRFLRPDQMQGIDALMTTKESFEAVEVLMGAMRGGSLPGVTPQAPVLDAHSLRQELNKLDPADTGNRSRLLKQLNDASGGEGKLV